MASASVALARCCEFPEPVIVTRAFGTNGPPCGYVFEIWQGAGYGMAIGGCALCFDEKDGR